MTTLPNIRIQKYAPLVSILKLSFFVLNNSICLFLARDKQAKLPNI
jgi:hypothetical protein